MLKELIIPDLLVRTNVEEEILLMVLGGRKQSVDWLNSISFNECIWAIDSGVDSCFAAGIIPEKLVGDADSADPIAWQWALDNGVSVSKYPRDKDLTDFQIALTLLSQETKLEKRAVFLTGCFGGRFDHLWSTFISFLNFSEKYIPIGMADEREGIIFLNGEDSVQMFFNKKPQAISLIPLSKTCTGVSICGVRWPLNNVLLEYRNPYCISNSIEDGKDVVVSVEKGRLGVYWEWLDVRD